MRRANLGLMVTLVVLSLTVLGSRAESTGRQGMELGLATNAAGAYELRLCDGANNCINPLQDDAGGEFAFDIGGDSLGESSARWGVALLAGLVSGVLVFKGGKYLVRRAAATDLARELHVKRLEEELKARGQELPAELRYALQKGKMRQKDWRALLMLDDLKNADIPREAELIARWDTQVAKLRQAVEQGKVFAFTGDFAASLENMRKALQALPQDNGKLAAIDELATAIRRNEISNKRALRKLDALDRDVHKLFSSKLLEEKWDKAMQAARHGLDESKVFQANHAVQQGLRSAKGALEKLGEQSSYQQLQKIAKDGHASADEIKAELAKIDQKLQSRAEVQAAKSVDAALQVVQDTTREKTAQRTQLIDALRKMQNTAQDNKKRVLDRAIQLLIRDIENGKEQLHQILGKVSKIESQAGILHTSAALRRWQHDYAKALDDWQRSSSTTALDKQLKQLERVLKDLKAKPLREQLRSLRANTNKLGQDDITARLNDLDQAVQDSTYTQNTAVWKQSKEQLRAILQTDHNSNWLAAVTELNDALHKAGDDRAHHVTSRLHESIRARQSKKKDMSTAELQKFGQQFEQAVTRSKSEKLRQAIRQWEESHGQIADGLSGSTVLQPTRELRKSLAVLQNILDKLPTDHALRTQLTQLQDAAATNGMSKQQIADALDQLENELRDSEAATALNLWQESVAQVNRALQGDTPLLEFDSALAGIWDEMAGTLNTSKLRATFATDVSELQRYLQTDDCQEHTLLKKIEKLDRQVQDAGGFRTAEELYTVSDKGQRAARRELRGRIASLRKQYRAARAQQRGLLDGTLHSEGAARGFPWISKEAFRYGGIGEERIIARDEVVAALHAGERVPKIEVRVGLEKLVAQLTGTAVFVSLPFVLSADDLPEPQLRPLPLTARDRGASSADNRPEALLPSLQRISTALGAQVAPTARCWLDHHTCVAGE